VITPVRLRDANRIATAKQRQISAMARRSFRESLIRSRQDLAFPQVEASNYK
jgi:hypothetical protein